MTTSNHLLGKIAFIQSITILSLIIAGAIYYQSKNEPPADMQRQTLFQRSINDAARYDENRIVRSLFALNEANSSLLYREYQSANYVKTVAWMSESSFAMHYSPATDCKNQACITEDVAKGRSPPIDIAQVWVTLVPQVQNFCRQLSYDTATFRLKQYLGLDPNRKYERFVELWVKPEDLFRPCIDPDPTDNACDLMPGQTEPTVEGIPSYFAFFDKLEVASYSAFGAPWTRLGYTYDWAYGEFGVGASEYIIVPESEFLIGNNYSTDEYCGE